MSGDRERLTELYTGNWRALFGYAARRCECAEDAADIVSEVFLTAWRRMDQVPLDGTAKLWLFGVARHALSNQRRSRRRRDRLGAALLAAVTEQMAPDPAELFLRTESDRRARAAMQRLPDRDRELLRLVSWEQLTTTQAAQVIGLSPTAARTRLSRARKRLAAMVAAAESEEPEATSNGAVSMNVRVSPLKGVS